jgi:tetratricopeptide (TPR) repeat protein
MRDASGEKRSIKGEDKVQSAAVKVIQSSRDPRARGTAYLFLELNDAAVETFEQAVNANGEDADLLNDLAAAYLARGKRGDYQAALDVLDRARKLKQSPTIEFNRALALQYLKRPDAIAAWQAYLKLDPDPKSGWAKEAQTNIDLLKGVY